MKTFKLFIIFAFLFNPIFEVQSADGLSAAAGKMDKAIGPYGVIIMSGIGMIYSSVLYKGAKEQEEEAEKNIKKLDEIIKSFDDSYASFCPNGREKLEEPKCYCYSSDGKKNTARSKSQTCTALWAQDDYKLAGNAADYANVKYDPNTVGCVAVSGEFDESCKCKKLVNAKGENACKKTTTITVNPEAYNPTLGTSTGLSEITGVLNSVLSGNGLGTINNAHLNQKAINGKKISDTLLKKLNVPASVIGMNEKNAGEFAKAVLGEKNIANAMKAYSSGGASQIASHSPSNSTMQNAVNKVKEDFKIETSGSGNGLKKNKVAKKDEFNFDMEAASSNGASNTLEGFDDAPKNYKYTNSDITTNESVSIFEIINNRYVQSGLKRLFEDETSSSVEKK